MIKSIGDIKEPVKKDKPFIIQYLREENENNFLYYKGVRYEADKYYKGPRVGVAVAVQKDPESYTIGFVLLSPKEPLFNEKSELAVFESSKGKIHKTVRKREKSIDWKRAIDLAYLRAMEQTEPIYEDYNIKTYSPRLKKRVWRSYQKFVQRCEKDLKGGLTNWKIVRGFVFSKN